MEDEKREKMERAIRAWVMDVMKRTKRAPLSEAEHYELTEWLIERGWSKPDHWLRSHDVQPENVPVNPELCAECAIVVDQMAEMWEATHENVVRVGPDKIERAKRWAIEHLPQADRDLDDPEFEGLDQALIFSAADVEPLLRAALITVAAAPAEEPGEKEEA